MKKTSIPLSAEQMRQLLSTRHCAVKTKRDDATFKAGDMAILYLKEFPNGFSVWAELRYVLHYDKKHNVAVFKITQRSLRASTTA